MYNCIIIITRFEANFAEHYPSGVEVQLDLDEPTDPIRNIDDDIACEVDQRVTHVVVDDRLVLVEYTAYAEVQHRPSEHAHLLGKHVVDVESNGGKVSNAFKLEDYLNYRLLLLVSISGASSRHRWSIGTVVLPADPFVALATPAIEVLSKVGVTLNAVGQLTEPADEVGFVANLAVVGEVEQVNFGSSAIALGHRVGQDAILNSKIKTFE